jgi:tetratricopeptide (TPR) repeat protein
MMILREVTISKLNVSKSNAENFILVSALGTLALLATFGSLQIFPVHASVVESLNSKINWYDDALAVNQNNVPALVQKGTDLVSLGKAEQSITWLDKALSIDPTNLMALISKGAALRELGQYPEAIIMYDRVLAIDPHDEYAIGGKADSLFGAGQHQQAVAWIDKVLEFDPNNGRILEVKETIQQSIN